MKFRLKYIINNIYLLSYLCLNIDAYTNSPLHITILLTLHFVIIEKLCNI